MVRNCRVELALSLSVSWLMLPKLVRSAKHEIGKNSGSHKTANVPVLYMPSKGMSRHGTKIATNGIVST
jgi:hypothetical protein